MPGIEEQVDYSVIRKDIGPLTVNFKGGIRPDGEVKRMSLSQFGSHIELSREQAVSLSRTIRARFGD